VFLSFFISTNQKGDFYHDPTPNTIRIFSVFWKYSYIWSNFVITRLIAKKSNSILAIMYTSPLKEFSRNDYFDQSVINDDMADFSFDIFFSGKRIGSRRDLIDLFVVTWIMDDTENIFIRYSIYSGDKADWKEKITDQLKILMQDINVSKEIISGRLRYFEVKSEKYLPTEAFEKKFLELKSRMKQFQEY